MKIQSPQQMPANVYLTTFRAALLLSEEEIGGGMRFSASCRGLARDVDIGSGEITVPVHVLQNIIRGALREVAELTVKTF